MFSRQVAAGSGTATGTLSAKLAPPTARLPATWWRKKYSRLLSIAPVYLWCVDSSWSSFRFHARESGMWQLGINVLASSATAQAARGGRTAGVYVMPRARVTDPKANARRGSSSGALPPDLQRAETG